MIRLGFAISLSLTMLASHPASAQQGGRVLLYKSGSSITLGYSSLTAAMTQAGASSVETSWPASLSEYRLVFLLDAAALQPQQSAALDAFAKAGGGVVLVGEPMGNGATNVNAVAQALGVSPRLKSGYSFNQCNELNSAGSSPLIAGAPTLSVSRGHVVQGGTALYASSAGAAAAVDGQVVVAGDTNSFANDGCMGCCSTSASTRAFWANLYAHLPKPKSPSPDGGPGLDGGVTTDGPVADGAAVHDAAPAGDDDGGGCALTGAPEGSGSWAWIVFLAAVLLIRRRS
jgi:Domain of unknown function (DUF4350)